MRTQLIAGNWKMNKGGTDGAELAKALVALVGQEKGVEVVVAPPFTALTSVSAALAGSNIELSAQNLYWKDSGAFTGEISASMLLSAGCKWVVIGHSERRQFFGETDATVRQRVQAALAAGLRPIICIGELLEEREAGKTLEVCFRQTDAFADLLAANPGFAVVAYEPVWAIGTGKVAGPDQAQEVHAAVRDRLKATSLEVAEKTQILYGGSVKADNAESLLGCADIDGALVGGASLDAAGFAAIVKAAPRG